MTAPDSNSSFHSFVDSPVPQIRKHSAGNLTGDLRKVKDLAADFHNVIMKWNSLNSQGLDIITKISNIKIEKVFNVQELSDSQQPQFLPLELNPLCALLLKIVDDMEKIVQKLESKTKIAESLVSLKSFQRSTGSSRDVLFLSMSLEDVAKTVQNIYKDYATELAFKKEVCKHVCHATNRGEVMFYTISWVHQPYISSDTQDQLQALLIETGHVNS
ncbi:hypothetical protein Btru_009493 [Bulinus truncatus]|nr:hypothetical protein Btru_009493 [Bulinus truncatus]